jgi:hypothetical protein
MKFYNFNGARLTGCNTIAIIQRSTTLHDIFQAISEKYKHAFILDFKNNSHKISFWDGNNTRSMCVFFGDAAMDNFNANGALVVLANYGNSVDILKHVCQMIGGLLNENDCNGKGFDYYEKQKLTA